MKNLPVLALLAAASLAPFAEASTNVTTTFGVSAAVQATCVISASALAFGNYTGVAASASTSVSVTCTNTTPYAVSLSAGLGSGATTTVRKMTGTGNAILNYGLYKDAAFSQNFGSTSGTDTYSGTGNGSAQSIPVYGQVAAGQYVAPGTYTDTITATVTY